MNYFWIIAFSLLIAIILLPLERKGYLNRTLLITGSLISAGINGICVIILGLGTDDGVLSVKTLIIYFVLNFIIAFCLRKQVPKFY